MRSLFLFLTLIIVSNNYCFAQNTNDDLRFIEVTGSAEKYVEPDEIRFHVGIEEYWKEEFEEGKEYKDYVTIIPLETIEKEVMQQLNDIGITKDQMIIKKVGNSWIRSGKGFKKSKLFELIITDFKMIDKITLKVNAKGVNILKIAELKHSKITQFRKEVKIEAMKAAKVKATYLLESVNEQLGQIISVIELNTILNSFWQPQNAVANTLLAPTNTENSANVNKIKLKYEVKTRFAID